MRRLVKLPGPVPTTIRFSSSRLRVGARQQLVDVLEQARRAPGALAEQLAVLEQRARGHVRRCVKRERQHVRSSIILRSPSGVAKPHAEARRGQLVPGRLGPLDEARPPRRSTARDRPTPPARRSGTGTGRGETTSTTPRYRCPMVKVGLVTCPSTPSARHAPRTNVVLPEPSSPETVTTSPGSRSAASSRRDALGLLRRGRLALHAR